MKWRVPLGAALVVLLAVPATGFGWFHSLFSRSSSRAAPVAVYYCPVPVAVVPVTAVPYAPPTVAAPAPARLYAEPRPAPASAGTPEPPRAPEVMPKAGAGVQEARKTGEKFFDSYFVTGGTRAAGDRCAVTFWNQSGQGLTLTVDGQARALPAGQSLRLDLKHEFAWTVAGRDSERQQVPAQESGVEIVIRR